MLPSIQMSVRPEAILSWSSGKDSAWTLHVLRQKGDVDVVALLTTINQVHDRVAMHAVRSALLRAQAEAAGVPLWPVPIPSPCKADVRGPEADCTELRGQGIRRRPSR